MVTFISGFVEISLHGTPSKWLNTSLYDLKYDTCSQSTKAAQKIPHHKVAQVISWDKAEAIGQILLSKGSQIPHLTRGEI